MLTTVWRRKPAGATGPGAASNGFIPSFRPQSAFVPMCRDSRDFLMVPSLPCRDPSSRSLAPPNLVTHFRQYRRPMQYIAQIILLDGPLEFGPRQQVG